MTYIGQIEANQRHQASPLILSDRFLRLAEEADGAGFRGAAEHLVNLAVHGLDAADYASASQPASGRAGSSRFDQLAAGASLVSMPRQAMLGALLGATLAPAQPGRPVLNPLWDREAMQRAHSMVRLIVALERKAPLGRGDLLGVASEYRIAFELAEALRSLIVADDAAKLPCSDVLRTIVLDVVELFGPVVGQVEVRTSIERIALPGFKRRALALAGCELAIDALRRGSGGRGVGHMTVMLNQVGRTRARLRVVDDGFGIPRRRCPQPSEILFDLAALLESDPDFAQTEDGGILAEIDFPISG